MLRNSYSPLHASPSRRRQWRLWKSTNRWCDPLTSTMPPYRTHLPIRPWPSNFIHIPLWRYYPQRRHQFWSGAYRQEPTSPRRPHIYPDPAHLQPLHSSETSTSTKTSQLPQGLLVILRHAFSSWSIIAPQDMQFNLPLQNCIYTVPVSHVTPKEEGMTR